MPDVVFIPSSVHLDFGAIPVVTMVRNMAPLELPFGGSSLADAPRNLVRFFLARRACRRSERVIAVSNHVRDFLVDRWKLDPQRVAVVYHGVDAGRPGRRPEALPDDGSPFLFTAGSVRPARGLEDLADTISQIPAGYRIVIAGEPDRETERYASRLRRRFASEQVLWLGHLAAQEMAWCFKNAHLFVMTSRAEACPNTVLEALAHRCLSVSTDQPPMPEFFHDAAVFYRRGDQRDLARAIGQCLALTESARNEMRERAIARSRCFTWASTVGGTLRELRRATEISG